MVTCPVCLCDSVCHTHTPTLHFLPHLGHSELLPARSRSRAQGIIVLLSHRHSDRYEPSIFPEFPRAFDRGGFSRKGPREPPLSMHFPEGHRVKSSANLQASFCGSSCPVTHSPESLARSCHRQLPAQAPRGRQMPVNPHSKATLSAPAGTWGAVPTTSRTLLSRLLPNFIYILTAESKDKVLEDTVAAKAGATAATATDCAGFCTSTHRLPCRTARNTASRLPPPCSQIIRLRRFSLFL